MVGVCGVMSLSCLWQIEEEEGTVSSRSGEREWGEGKQAEHRQLL